MTLHAYVVLPDRLHCLWRLPPGDDDIATRWRHIETTFSRALPNVERLSERRRRKSERGIWQRRYWERLIRDDEGPHGHRGGVAPFEFQALALPRCLPGRLGGDLIGWGPVHCMDRAVGWVSFTHPATF